MFNSILLAYDRSASAMNAFHCAVALAQKYKASLYVLSLVPPPDFIARAELALHWVSPTGVTQDVELGPVIRMMMKDFRMDFRRMRCNALDRGVAVEFHVQMGSPIQHIVRYARDRAVDLVVLGHCDHASHQPKLKNSVAESIVDQVTCPVLLIR